MVCNCLRSADQSASLDRPEVVLSEIVSDLIAKHRSLYIGGAEVDPGPHSGVDDLLGRVREPLKVPCRTGFVAERAEANLVGTKEVLERLYERRGRAAVA